MVVNTFQSRGNETICVSATEGDAGDQIAPNEKHDSENGTIIENRQCHDYELKEIWET